MKGKIISRRGRHALVCDGWDYYDMVERRLSGDGGRPIEIKQRIGTFAADADALSAWFDYLKLRGVSK